MTHVAELSGAWNFRDVAASTDGEVKPGRLFRAGELSRLDDAGRAVLVNLGLTDVADLRSAPEVLRHGPGLVPDGITIHLLPFVEVPATDPATESPNERAFQRLLTDKPANESIDHAAIRFMIDEYGRFARSEGAQRAVRTVIGLLGSDRSVLAHCFAGKDRTGFIVAVVLEALGVDRDTVMADYLESNDAAPLIRAHIMEMINNRAGGEIPTETLEFTETRLSDDVLGVRADYLDGAWQTIDEVYGSFAGYLQAAEVTEADLASLHAALRLG
jgi:protein-tyrosine phosphatase